MLRQSLILVFLVFTSKLAWTQGNPDKDYKINSIEIENTDNDFFGTWDGSISNEDGRDAINLNAPIKAEIPDDFVVRFRVISNGEEMSDSTMSVCDCLEDQTIGKSVVDTIQPQDDFSKNCPISAGEWKIGPYLCDKENFAGFTPGELVVICTIGKEDQPLITLTVNGEIIQE